MCCVTSPSWISHIVRKPLEIQSLTTSSLSSLDSLIWFKIWGDFTLPISIKKITPMDYFISTIFLVSEYEPAFNL